MNKRRVLVASCLSLAFGLLGTACAGSSGAFPGMSEPPQGPLQLRYEELSEPVITYMSEHKTLDELVEIWEAVTGETCRAEVFGEERDPTGRNCNETSIVLVYDSTSELLQDTDDIAQFYESEYLEGYRLMGTNWAISGEPEVLAELHQELGGVQISLGRPAT